LGVAGVEEAQHYLNSRQRLARRYLDPRQRVAHQG